MTGEPITGGASTALDTAIAVLRHLEIAEPPLTPKQVLDGLGLTWQSLPAFDVERLTPQQLRAFGQVRGLLDPTAAKVYTSTELAPRQEPWIVFHEIGHAAIEWHRDLLYLDTEYTLSPRVRGQLEREANEFAGHLRFLGPRFEAEARELPFGVPAVLTLNERYDASIESSMRRYIETRAEMCVCNVFRIVAHADGQHALKFQYFIRPVGQRGRWKFPYTVGQVLPPNDELAILLNDGKLGGGIPYEETRFDPSTAAAYQRQIVSTGHAVFVVTRRL